MIGALRVTKALNPTYSTDFLAAEINKEFWILYKLHLSSHGCDGSAATVGESIENYNQCKLNTITLRQAKIVYNFGLSECNRVKAVICKLPYPMYTCQNLTMWDEILLNFARLEFPVRFSNLTYWKIPPPLHLSPP